MPMLDWMQGDKGDKKKVLILVMNETTECFKIKIHVNNSEHYNGIRCMESGDIYSKLDRKP